MKGAENFHDAKFKIMKVVGENQSAFQKELFQYNCHIINARWDVMER